jgi:hypothetical protein
VPIAKITGQGLTAIGCSVALLWGFFLAERNLTRQAFQERVRVMRDVRRLHPRQNPIPVSIPFPHAPARIPVTAG